MPLSLSSRSKFSLNGSGSLRIFQAASVTFLDQLTLSLGQLFIGLAFIYRGNVEDYGLFTFFMALFYFFVSLQNAMINTPMMVISPRMSNQAKISFERGLFAMLCFGILGATCLCLVWAGASQFLQSRRSFTVHQMTIFALTLGPLILREFWRAEEFANLRPSMALRRDIAYVSVVLVQVWLLSTTGSLDVATAFLAMAFAAAVVVFTPSFRNARPLPTAGEIQHSFTETWKFSRWSMLGAAASWFQNCAYIYLPFFLLGVRQVAYLAAARLVMTPANLLARSWSNFLRPAASRNIAAGDLTATSRIFIMSTVALIGLLVLYTSAVSLLLLFLPEPLLPEEYRGIDRYVLLWAAVIFLSIVRNNTSCIFQSHLAFRPLALRAGCSALFTVLATAFFVTKVGSVGALFGQLAGEMFLMVLLIAGFRSLPNGQLMESS